MDTSTQKSTGLLEDCHRQDGAAVRGDPSEKKSSRGLWLWVGLIFTFSLLLWVAMFAASRHIDTREVPLATKGAKP
jgi:hypothetical protein